MTQQILRAGEAAPEAPATSLVLYSESVDGISDDLDVKREHRLCPKRPYVVVCDQDPEMRFPMSCDAYRCEICGPRKALQAAAIAAWATRQVEHPRFITLTMMPADWTKRRQKMRDLKRLLKRRGYDVEWAWTTEKGTKTGMIHVHALQHGDYVPQRLLQEVVGSRVDIRAIKSDGVARYVTKDALKVAGYTVKGSTATYEGLERHLDLNGGRAMHWSRGFLHGATKRDALGLLKEELGNSEGLTWHLELAEEVRA